MSCNDDDEEKKWGKVTTSLHDLWWCIIIYRTLVVAYKVLCHCQFVIPHPGTLGRSRSTSGDGRLLWYQGIWTPPLQWCCVHWKARECLGLRPGRIQHLPWLFACCYLTLSFDCLQGWCQAPDCSADLEIFHQAASAPSGQSWSRCWIPAQPSPTSIQKVEVNMKKVKVKIKQKVKTKKWSSSRTSIPWELPLALSPA